MLVVVVGALVRLAWLHQATFLGDQAQLLSLARSALEQHALPVTGIRSSIGTLNPPVSIYLLLPFALSGDPLWATLGVALANIVAVALVYAIADRYAGRAAGVTAGLLYATAPWPVYFSRFVWQQNFLAPVVLLFFWTLCRGVLERRRGWLAWNVALWGVAVQLHPSAAPLALLTAVGVAATIRQLRWRDFAAASAALFVLFLPTLLWEAFSGGSDFTLLSAYARLPAVVNGDALAALSTALTPPASGAFGPDTDYAAAYQVFGWLSWGLSSLYVLSVGWLLAVLGRRVLRARDVSLVARLRPRWRRALEELARRAAPLPDWRLLALLALWQAAPLAAMLKHGKRIEDHYLLALLPAVFLLLGIFLAWLAPLAASLSTTAVRRVALRWRVPEISSRWMLGAALLLLAGSQTASIAAEIATIQSGRFDGVQGADGVTHYGLPLDAQRAALAAAVTDGRARGARVLVATTDLHQQSLGYLAVAGGADATVYDGSNCLLAPAAGSAPAVTLVTAPVAAANALSQLPGAHLLRALPAIGDVSPQLYFMPAGARLAGEVAVAPGEAGTPTYLAGYQVAGTPEGAVRLWLRWSGAPPVGDSRDALTYWYGARDGAPAADYTFFAQPVDAAGRALGPVYASTCPALAWGRGEDIYTWVALPRLRRATGASAIAGWRVWAERQVLRVRRPRLGPLTLETGSVYLAAPERLPGATLAPLVGG